MSDLFSLVTADGNGIYFPDEARAILAHAGFGAPPTQFIRRTTRDLVGSIEVDYVLSPRLLTLHLWAKPEADRQDWWDQRLALHEFLRPNRGGPITLTLIQPDGTKRSIVVRASPGLVFPAPSPDGDIWRIEENLEFVALDPIWYDPDETVYSAVATTTTWSKVFNVANVGTWQVFPALTITGPFTQFVFTNGATGAVITLAAAVTSVQSRTITLTPGALTVVDQDGVDRFSEIDPPSDFVQFFLAPDAVAAITADISGASAGQTSVSVAFNARYFGI